MTPTCKEPHAQSRALCKAGFFWTERAKANFLPLSLSLTSSFIHCSLPTFPSLFSLFFYSPLFLLPSHFSFCPSHLLSSSFILSFVSPPWMLIFTFCFNLIYHSLLVFWFSKPMNTQWKTVNKPQSHIYYTKIKQKFITDLYVEIQS